MKQMKVLSVFGMLAMTLGLAACGGGTKECANNKHTWGKWVEVTPATCTVDGTQKRVCEKCKKEETKAIKAGHKWGDWTDVKVATCQEKGSQKRVCSACNAEETRETDLADHSWGEWETVTEADCLNAGSRKHKCSVCETEETETVNALGHDWGEWEELVAPTCTEKGSRKHKCQRCQLEETEEVAALGHKYELVGDETEPEAGKAKVRIYTCANGCGSTTLGFKANEPSAESLKHLVVGDDGGARFWGRPIGNDVPLNDAGDPDRDNHPAIFNKQQTGDFFEYVFDLTEEQAAVMQNVRCYCDAKPADYLGRNGIDFWANTAGSEDWTRGMYIDDNPEHLEVDSDGNPVMVDVLDADGNPTGEQVQKGKEITDYRYVLYVDDEIKQFDGTPCPVPTSEDRAEYMMPYIFNFHKGTNKISLRMAGGYRSTFYNFTFRPVEEQGGGGEEQHVHEYADAKAGTLETEGCTPVDVFNCKENDASVLRWEAKAFDATLSNAIEAAASDGSIRFDHAQGKGGEEDKGGHLVYKINSPVAVEKAGLDFYIQAHNQNVAIFDAVANDSGAGKDVDTDGKYTVTPTKRYALYVNDERVEIGEDPGKSTAKAWFTWPVEFPLKKGENKIEIVSLGGYRAKMYNFQLTGLPKINIPVKSWSSADIKAGLTEGNNLKEKDFNNSLPGVKGYKFNDANTTCTLTYEAAEAGTFAFELLLGVKKGNQAKTGFWYQVDSTQNPLPAKDKITVNGKDVVPPEKDVEFSDATVESDQSDSGTLMVPVWKTVCNVELQQGANTIVLTYLAGGYSLYLCGARLSK